MMKVSLEARAPKEAAVDVWRDRMRMWKRMHGRRPLRHQVADDDRSSSRFVPSLVDSEKTEDSHEGREEVWGYCGVLCNTKWRLTKVL
jgi:hypothetical protein